MTDSEYEELLALLDKLIVQQEDQNNHSRGDHLAEAYLLVQDCQKDDLGHG